MWRERGREMGRERRRESESDKANTIVIWEPPSRPSVVKTGQIG